MLVTTPCSVGLSRAKHAAMRPHPQRMVHTHARRKRSEAEELARRANAKFSGNAGKLSDTNYEVLGQLLGSSEDEIAATLQEREKMRELSGEEVSPDSFLVSTPVYVKPNYADFDALLERGGDIKPMKRKGDLPATKAKPAKAKPPSASTSTSATDDTFADVYDEREQEGDRAESLSSIRQTHADLEMLLARRNAPAQRRGSAVSKPGASAGTATPLLPKPKLPGGAVAAAARARRDEREKKRSLAEKPAAVTTPQRYKPPAVLKAKPQLKPKPEKP